MSEIPGNGDAQVKISCPSCEAKYSIADEKVQNRLAKIRCRKCGTSIVIDGNVSPPSVYAGEAGDTAAGDSGAEVPAANEAASAAAVFTVDYGEGDQRQQTLPEVVAAYNAGQITAQTYVWAEGFPDWKALGDVSEIVAALHAGAAARPVDSSVAAAQSTAPDESPWAASAAKAAAPKAAAADLFGNYDRAGSEQDVSTSAVAGGGAVANPFARPAASSPAGTGARNESSVLFSLSALTSASGGSRPSVPAPSAPSAGGGGSTSDDSGLIDLKALTAAAEAQARPAAASPFAPMGVAPLAAPAPLGVPSPLGAPMTAVAAEAAMPAQKSNAGLFIIGGFILVGMLGGGAVFAMMSKGDPTPPAVASVAAPVAAAPAPTPTMTSAPLPTSDAKAPSTGTETEPAPSATATAKKPTTSTSTVKKPTTTSSTTSSSSSTSSSTKPASGSTTSAPPKANKCGCKSGDLMCEIACSSKKK